MFPSPPLIKFADSHLIQAKFGGTTRIQHKWFLSVFQSWDRRILFLLPFWYKWQDCGSIMIWIFKKKRYRYCHHSLWNNWESITKKDPTRQWNNCYYRISSNQGFIKFEKIKIKAWSFHGTAAVCETHWSYRQELYRFLEARPNYWFGYWKAFWLWALGSGMVQMKPIKSL